MVTCVARIIDVSWGNGLKCIYVVTDSSYQVRCEYNLLKNIHVYQSHIVLALLKPHGGNTYITEVIGTKHYKLDVFIFVLCNSHITSYEVYRL